MFTINTKELYKKGHSINEIADMVDKNRSTIARKVRMIRIAEWVDVLLSEVILKAPRDELVKNEELSRALKQAIRFTEKWKV